jgi:hypothetical protein
MPHRPLTMLDGVIIGLAISLLFCAPAVLQAMGGGR